LNLPIAMTSASASAAPAGKSSASYAGWKRRATDSSAQHYKPASPLSGSLPRTARDRCLSPLPEGTREDGLSQTSLLQAEHPEKVGALPTSLETDTSSPCASTMLFDDAQSKPAALLAGARVLHVAHLVEPPVTGTVDADLRASARRRTFQGTDRNRLTYAAANHDNGRVGDRRITASTVPHAMPAATATPVIPSDTFIPCHRNGSNPGMELQSKSYMAISRPGGESYKNVTEPGLSDPDL
jgi:hypothetical protein